MLNKILKVMLIVILLPMFAMCTAPFFMAGGIVAEGVKQGYEEAEQAQKEVM